MTYEELMQAARRAHAANQPDHARRLVQRANELRNAPPNEPDMSLRGRLRDNFVGTDDGVTSAGEYVAHMLNKGGQGLTFGFGDEADAAVRSAVNGQSYDENLQNYRDKEQAFAEEFPVASSAAEIGGAVIPALAGVGAVAQAPTRGAQIARTVGLGAAEGAAYGFGNGEGGFSNRAEQAGVGAALGGAIGAAAPLVGGVVRSAVNGNRTRRMVRDAAKGAPTSQELREAGQAAYQRIDDAGVEVSPSSFEALRQQLTDRLRSETGFDELPGPGSLTPNTARVAQIMEGATGRMADEPTAGLPFRSLDQMRRQAGAAAGNVTNKADQQAGMTLIDGLDDYVARLGPDDVVTGNPEQLQQAIPEARELWSRMSRSQLVDDAIAQEGNYVSGGASAIRNQFARILRNPRLANKFSEAERGAMRRVVQGTPLERTINLLGGGLGGLGQMGIGVGAGGFPGFLAGAASSAATRGLSEKITRHNAEVARAAIASGRLNSAPAIAEQRASDAILGAGFTGLPALTQSLSDRLQGR